MANRLKSGIYSIERRYWAVYGNDAGRSFASTVIGGAKVEVSWFDVHSPTLEIGGSWVDFKADPALKKILDDGMKAIDQAAAAYERELAGVIEEIRKDLP